MKHILTEAEVEQNPQLNAQVGDKVDEPDILYPIIPTDFVGGKADNILRHANSPHSYNNRINVMDGDKLVKTYSGDKDGTNWKKYAELYAKLNDFILAAYKPIKKTNGTTKRPSGSKANEGASSRPAKAATRSRKS